VKKDMISEVECTGSPGEDKLGLLCLGS